MVNKDYTHAMCEIAKMRVSLKQFRDEVFDLVQQIEDPIIAAVATEELRWTLKHFDELTATVELGLSPRKVDYHDD